MCHLVNAGGSVGAGVAAGDVDDVDLGADRLTGGNESAPARAQDPCRLAAGRSGDLAGLRPADQVPCDLWLPPARIPFGHGQVRSPPVLEMVSWFSRFITTTMIPSCTIADLLTGPSHQP